ncbi:MAG: hypothetical protein H6711_04565 [Myxococcales bacterium]|nr:hypothetical protein [Myxococcales bacterium]
MGCQRSAGEGAASASASASASAGSEEGVQALAATTPASGPPWDEGSTAEPQYRVVAASRGEGAPSFRVFGGDGGELFVAHGAWLMRADADGQLARDPAWIRGVDPPLGEAALVESVAGRGPEGLVMVTRLVSPGRGDAEATRGYRWGGDRWLPLDRAAAEAGSYPARIEGWRGGSVLALLAPVDGASLSSSSLVVYAGDVAPPRIDGRIVDFDALSSGELAVLVADPPRVLTYDPAGGEARTRPLPEAAGAELEGIVLARPDRGHVFGRAAPDEGGFITPYLAGFDGEAWRAEKGPPCGAGVFAASWSERDGLYAICHNDRDPGIYPSGDLWRRISGGWIEVELPYAGSVTGVVAEGPGGVWIATTRALFGPKAPKAVLDVDGVDAPGRSG